MRFWYNSIYVHMIKLPISSFQMHFQNPAFVLSSSLDCWFSYHIFEWTISYLYCMFAFLYQWAFTFCNFFFLVVAFSFLPKEVPLVMLVWWCWILFACLWSFWILHHIWIRVLLSILGSIFPFHHFKYIKWFPSGL